MILMAISSLLPLLCNALRICQVLLFGIPLQDDAQHTLVRAHHSSSLLTRAFRALSSGWTSHDMFTPSHLGMQPYVRQGPRPAGLLCFYLAL
jgi:hypothetical protein